VSIVRVLPCAATNCREQFGNGKLIGIRELHDAALAVGWRHDEQGDWCPWHSPEQEAAGRGSINTRWATQPSDGCQPDGPVRSVTNEAQSLASIVDECQEGAERTAGNHSMTLSELLSGGVVWL
jgi:hypothetical protein